MVGLGTAYTRKAISKRCVICYVLPWENRVELVGGWMVGDVCLKKVSTQNKQTNMSFVVEAAIFFS